MRNRHLIEIGELTVEQEGILHRHFRKILTVVFRDGSKFSDIELKLAAIHRSPPKRQARTKKQMFEVWQYLLVPANALKVSDICQTAGFSEVGVEDDAEELIRAISGNSLGRRSKKPLQLVLVSVSRLGFPHGSSLSNVFNAGEKAGLSLCPAWTAILLVAQHGPDLPTDSVRIAMQSVACGKSRKQKVLKLSKEIEKEGEKLFIRTVAQDVFVAGGDKIVFMIPG